MEIRKARYSMTRRSKKSRVRRAVSILLAVLITGALSGYIALAVNKPFPALAQEQTLAQAVSVLEAEALAWPATGQAAFGTLGDGVLAQTPNEQQNPMASITKLVTALAVLEKHPLQPGEAGPLMVMSQSDIDNYRRYISMYGAVMPVSIGQKITQADAMKGMLLPSANNMADALAIWAFGSMQQYLEYANSMLQRLGLERTVVADASGFSPGSKSTPSELIRLGQMVLNHEILAEIVGTKSVFIPGSGTMNSTNMLLSDVDAIGIKTGNTDEAGSCLLYAYKFGPEKEHVFIGVVMGQPSYYGMFNSARELKDSALANFKLREIVPAGTVVGKVASIWGDSVNVVTAKPIKIYGWPGLDYEVEAEFNDLGTPLIDNQVIGRASAGGSSTDLIADGALDGPGFLWRLANYW